MRCGTTQRFMSGLELGPDQHLFSFRACNFRRILHLLLSLQIEIQLLEPLHDLFHLAQPRLQLVIAECKKQILDENYSENSEEHDPKYAI